MLIDLAGRTALVTGSTGGIGRATVAGLASAGATVVVNGRSAEKVEATVAAISEVGSARGVVADVGTAEGCATLVAAVPAVDILVNNAATTSLQPVLEIADEEWERVFATNVMSGVRLSRAYVPGMVERGWGRVIFISSESALQIPPEMVHYGMTKMAQIAVARGIAESFPDTGVTVNSVLPGPTLTDGFAQLLFDGDIPDDHEERGREFLAAARPTSLLARLASPEEVANLIVYVASPQASATNGAALRVDGGVVRAIP